MALTVRFRDVEIKCDTADEAIALTKKLAGLESSAALQIIGQSPPDLRNRFQAMCAELSHKNKELLRNLKNRPNGISGSELSRILGYQGTANLSGVLATISKAAKRHGLQVGNLWTKRRLRTAKGKDWLFKATTIVNSEPLA